MTTKYLIIPALLLSMAWTKSARSQTAEVQIIHNSADTAFQTVDVYAGTALLVDNFDFRTATPFTTVPAGVQINIGIAPGNSTSSTDAVANFNVSFGSGMRYIVVADGIPSSTGYSPAPAFDLKVYSAGRNAASSSSNTDVLVHHGSTDAPVVDVFAPISTSLVDNLGYGSFSQDYLELPTDDYRIQVRNTAGTDVVAEYSAPLQTLGLQGEALVVVASGFLNPAQNSNGPAFGLYAALSSGGQLVALPTETISSTRVQVIHNCADTLASEVDVYLNDTRILDNFAFRTASPFVDVPAGTAFRVTVCPPSSTDTSGRLAGYTYTLDPSMKYILVAGGTIGSGYSPSVPFNIAVFGGAREASSSDSTADVLVHHGSTDAPTVDVAAEGAGTLIENLRYATFNPYLSLPEADYVINVLDSTGSVKVAGYQAPLSTLNLGGQALTIVASGFLNPGQNNNGPAFGLWVATSAGGNLIELPLATPTSVESVQIENAVRVYPNPANDVLFINLPAAVIDRVIISDMNGRQISTGAYTEEGIEIADLPQSIYTIRVFAAGKIYHANLVK